MSPTSLQSQRDLALASMILILCVALAVFLSVFGNRDAVAMANTQKAVAIHEALRAETSRALQQNLEALASVEASLAARRKARAH